MTEKKKIPCRVCGELFTPCAYCQSHADVFRWRNFACSRECAKKYFEDTIAYRESLKDKSELIEETKDVTKEVSVKKTSTTRKKRSKKTIDVVENEETE